MNKLVELEWRQNKRSFWIAFLLVGLLQAIPAFAAKSYLENETMVSKTVGKPHQETLTTFEGWISGQPCTFFLLILGSFAINWSIGTIVKDRDRQTTEFLYTMPCSRTSIYWAKWLTSVFQVLIIVVISTGISGLNDNLNWLAILSLFNLFDVYDISQGGGLPVGTVMGAFALFVAGSFAGWMKLIHRDL